MGLLNEHLQVRQLIIFSDPIHSFEVSTRLKTFYPGKIK